MLQQHVNGELLCKTLVPLRFVTTSFNMTNVSSICHHHPPRSIPSVFPGLIRWPLLDLCRHCFHRLHWCRHGRGRWPWSQAVGIAAGAGAVGDLHVSGDELGQLPGTTRIHLRESRRVHGEDQEAARGIRPMFSGSSGTVLTSLILEIEWMKCMAAGHGMQVTLKTAQPTKRQGRPSTWASSGWRCSETYWWNPQAHPHWACDSSDSRTGTSSVGAGSLEGSAGRNVKNDDKLWFCSSKEPAFEMHQICTFGWSLGI